MRRRQFLNLATGALLTGVSWRLWAAPSGGSNARFILVFLRGGYDALSALVPYNEPFYYEARPNIAIPAPSQGKTDTVIALDERWGLLPALQETILPLYEAKQVVFVPFAGTAFVSRSHFQAQDWLEFGQPSGPIPSHSTGFLNRLLERLHRDQGQATAISFTSTLPPILRGAVQVANSPITVPKRAGVDANREELILAMYQGHALEPLVRDGIGLRREISKELQEQMQSASRGAMPAKGFALQAARIGRLLRERPEYRIGFIELGGWDTHAAQGNALGTLSRQLHGLGEGLSVLADSLGPTWNNTVVAVVSEFGRTFRENGSKGTDHGHGSTLWLLGGGISGGGIHGEQARLRESDLHQNRDLPVLNEYRAVLATVFQKMYGLDALELRHVFPGLMPGNKASFGLSN
jgi:uncharacterized protein (DUF1501 family)